jgi:hypothetical protein
MMKVGFAEYDITPPIGKNIPGGFKPWVTEEPARGKLLATAMAVTAQGTTLILVSTDTLSMQVSFSDRIRNRISEATGVPFAQIMIASTHTHTGGAPDYQLWLCPPDPEVAGLTEKGVVNAAIEAYRNQCEARLGVGIGEERRFSFCRDFYMADGTMRMNPPRKTDEDRAAMLRTVATPDHSVNVMRVDDENGDVRGFIVNYANHPDCHAKDKKSFSADFPGALRRTLKRIYGEDLFVLFFNGTAGDINCIDYKNQTDKSYYSNGKNAPEAIGAGLGSTVVEINMGICADVTEPVLGAISGSVQLDRRYKSEEQFRWAQEIAKDMESHDSQTRAYATEYLESDDDVTPIIDFEIHTLLLGPWAIVGLPSEIFTDIGKLIKRASPFEHTLIVELANGTHGYLATKVAHDYGLYETKLSKINACTAPDSASRVVDATLKQLYRLKEQIR